MVTLAGEGTLAAPAVSANDTVLCERIRSACAGVITIDPFPVAVLPALSVTVKVKPEVAAAVGRPEIWFPERLSPAGKLPDVTARVEGAAPPVAHTICTG